VVYDFAYEGPGMAKGGVGTITVDGVKVGEGRLDKTQPGIFSVDDLADVGMDLGTPVGNYAVPFRFNGKIHKVTIDVKK
jgi:arylsulfatase